MNNNKSELGFFLCFSFFQKNKRSTLRIFNLSQGRRTELLLFLQKTFAGIDGSTIAKNIRSSKHHDDRSSSNTLFSTVDLQPETIFPIDQIIDRRLMCLRIVFTMRTNDMAIQILREELNKHLFRSFLSFFGKDLSLDILGVDHWDLRVEDVPKRRQSFPCVHRLTV